MATRHNAGPSGQSRGGKWITPEKRAAIHKRDGWLCVYCHQPVRPRDPSPSGATLDHIVSRDECVALYGKVDNDAKNLVTACRSCNSRRGNVPMVAWIGKRAASFVLNAAKKPLGK